MVHICANATHSLDACLGCSASLVRLVLICDSLPGHILVSGSDLLKHWRATHSLDKYSAILISDSDLLKHWRATYSLDKCSTILISGSDLLKHWRATHKLDKCSAILISISDLLKH